MFDEFDEPFYDNIKKKYMTKDGHFITRFDIIGVDFFYVGDSSNDLYTVNGFYFTKNLEESLLEYVEENLMEIPEAMKILKGLK